MDYVLIEFLAIFFWTLFKGMANIAVETLGCEPIFNALITFFIIFIFSVFAIGTSKVMFDPFFAIIQNLWNVISVEVALGYITAYILASLLATALLTMSVPSEYVANIKTNVGAAKLNPDLDEFGVLTMQMAGSFFVFLGYLYYADNSKGKELYSRAFYYAGACGALQLSTYMFNGGDYNLATTIGGMLFSSSADTRAIYSFFGNFLGLILAKLLYEQVLVEKSQVKENKTIKKMLKR